MNNREPRESDFFAWNWKDNKQSVLVFCCFFGAIAAIDSLWTAIDEKRPVGGFFEQFVAIVAFYLMIIGAVWFGGWVGTRAFEKSNSKFLGWVMGLRVMGSVFFIADLLVSHIPGVDWRYKLMSKSGDEY